MNKPNGQWLNLENYYFSVAIICKMLHYYLQFSAIVSEER